MLAAILWQEDVSLQEVRQWMLAEFQSSPGVRDIAVGSGGLLVQVENEAARKIVRDRCAGEVVRGHKLHFVVALGEGVASKECRSCSCPCHKAGKTTAQPRKVESGHPAETCDIYLEIMNLPKRAEARPGAMCEQIIGWTTDAAKLKWLVERDLPHHSSRNGSGVRGQSTVANCKQHGAHLEGEFTSYILLRHRKNCPMSGRESVQDIQKK